MLKDPGIPYPTKNLEAGSGILGSITALPKYDDPSNQYWPICLLYDVIGCSRISNSCNRNSSWLLSCIPDYVAVPAEDRDTLQERNATLYVYDNLSVFSRKFLDSRRNCGETLVLKDPLRYITSALRLASCISVLLSILYQGKQLPS